MINRPGTLLLFIVFAVTACHRTPVTDTEEVHHAVHAYNARLGELQSAYRDALQGLANPPVLTTSTITSQADLKSREDRVSQYISASQQLLDFEKNSEATFRQALADQKLSPADIDANMAEFKRTTQDIHPAVTAVYEADVTEGNGMLKVLTLLDSNWGHWKYTAATSQLQFQTQKMTAEYVQAVKDMNAASDTSVQLKARLKAVSAKSNPN